MEILQIQSKIIEIRNQRVLLDRDLAEMYNIETRVLKQAVKRNIKRFAGEDFMFQLSENEIENMVSQFVIPSKKHFGGAQPFVFTELGVAMLSSVLNSEVAIEVNRNIMRAFVMIRQFALNYAELNHKLDDFMAATNTQFSEVYQVLTELVEQKKIEEKPRIRVGFVQNSEKTLNLS